MTATGASYIAWGLFLLSWIVAANWTGRATARAPGATAVGYVLLYNVGFALLFMIFPGGGTASSDGFSIARLSAPLWHVGAAGGAALVAVELAGFAFAWWARLELGRLWSGFVTVREGHRVVDTGPYRWVRHPIYTGFLLAAAGLSLLRATPLSILGTVLIGLVFVVKARLEERFLRQELGEAGYDAYAARTPMLAPFMPW